MTNTCEPRSLNNSEKGNVDLKGIDLVIEQLEGIPSEKLNNLPNAESPPQDLAPGIELPPDGGYGWVCVAACFTINCFTWGVVSVGRHAFSCVITFSANSCVVIWCLPWVLSCKWQLS
jgi:hypothetical protein